MRIKRLDFRPHPKFWHYHRKGRKLTAVLHGFYTPLDVTLAHEAQTGPYIVPDQEHGEVDHKCNLSKVALLG